MTMNNPLGTAPEALREIANRTWQSMIGIGIASAILGVIVLAWPGKSVFVVAVLFGVYLFVSGVFQIAATFGVQHSHGWWRFLSFVSGAVSILLSFVAFRNIADAVILLALWIGIGWVFRGVTELSVFMDAGSGLPGRGWGIFTGIITVVAGGVLIIWPISSIGTLAVVSGIMLLVIGLVEIFHAVTLRSKLKAFDAAPSQ